MNIDNNIKKVLICLDNTAHSIKVANEGIIAKSINTEVSLIHVIDTNAVFENTLSAKEIVESKKDKARKFLENVLTMYSCAALIYVDEGNPSEKIIEKVKTLNVDLVVLGTSKRNLPENVVKNVTRQIKNLVIIV